MGGAHVPVVRVPLTDEEIAELERIAEDETRSKENQAAWFIVMALRQYGPSEAAATQG